MKTPDPRAKPYYCSKCGSPTCVTDDAEVWFSVDTGLPHYYYVDRACPTHGRLHEPRKIPTIFGIPLFGEPGM